MVYSFTRRVDGQDIYATHVNELQAAIESLSSDAAAYLDVTETQALIDAAITGSGDLPASPGMGHDLASGPVAWRGAQVRDIRDWYYEDDTRTDLQVFQAMAADIAAAGGGSVAVTAKPEGDGTWGWSITPDENICDLPSNIYLFGAGEGGGQMRPTDGDTHVEVNPAMFRAYGPVSGGRIEGLTFRGDNGTDGDGFVWVLNYVSNCILFVADDFSLGPYDWRVDRCTFRDLHGFSVHSTGGHVDHGPRRLAVTDSVFTYNGNGVNLCGAQVQARGNTFLHCEGFENTGRGIVLADNTGIDMIGAGAAIGGSSQDDGPAVIVGNSFYGSTGEGLSIGDGVRNALVAGNVVVGAETVAFRNGTAFDPEFAPRNLTITGNVFRVAPTASIAVILSAIDCVFDHNSCGGGTQESLQIGGENGVYRGNVLDLGTSTPRAFQTVAGATNNFFGGDNAYTPFGYYDASGGTATFAPGSEFRFTSQPAASAMWRGCTISVQGGAGVADTHARCTKDAADAYGWRDLLT